MGQCTPNSNVKTLSNGSSVSSNSPKDQDAASSKNSFIPQRPILKNKNIRQCSLGKLNEIRKLQKVNEQIKIKIKAPVDNSSTVFKWIDSSVMVCHQKIIELPLQIIKKGTFQEKLAWFRAKIQILKKEHRHGFQLIQIDRQNVISSSLNALEDANLFKQFKIQFKGDQAEDAGGGLLRQWMHLCIKQIMSSELGIFKQANTDETAYSIVWGNPSSDELTVQALSLLGKIMAKAIIQKMSINCPLDYTIVRQLCSQPLHLSDVYSYDKQFYKSWSIILQSTNVQELCLNGAVVHNFSENQSEQIQLFPNGKNIIITDRTKEDYIIEMISLYCSKSIEMELEELFEALTSSIPAELLSIFQPYEFEMIINGPATIDIKDWRKNTNYEGYQPNCEVVNWFWQTVQSYSQEGFRNLLHYCTGSMRVPIMGFSKLQTSHGHVKKFTIRKVEYSSQNPYPKSYTCFNRLDLPEYKSKEELKEKLAFILKEQFTYFGLC